MISLFHISIKISIFILSFIFTQWVCSASNGDSYPIKYNEAPSLSETKKITEKIPDLIKSLQKQEGTYWNDLLNLCQGMGIGFYLVHRHQVLVDQHIMLEQLGRSSLNPNKKALITKQWDINLLKDVKYAPKIWVSNSQGEPIPFEYSTDPAVICGNRRAQVAITKLCKAIRQAGLQNEIGIGFFKYSALPVLEENEIYQERTVKNKKNELESIVTIARQTTKSNFETQEGYIVAVGLQLSENNQCVIMQRCFKDVEYGYHEQVNW